MSIWPKKAYSYRKRVGDVQNIPAQKKFTDCGVFVCAYAEHLSRKAGFRFSQDDMPKIRVQMMKEIVSSRLSSVEECRKRSASGKCLLAYEQRTKIRKFMVRY